ncbi:hypothetical protein [Niabella aurantiaca]|uniref:hypothetical protein n=1 Tax=Niabella aurantiaca TaxID=379900 RepID=UPI00037B0372|nr:hypothetical protein [Niabella aurantiaca]
MKKIMLTAIAVFLFAIVHAQLKRSKDYLKGGTDTTWHDLSGSLKRTKTITGNARLRTEPGKYTLYASYKNRRITGYYAMDTKGHKIPVTYTTKAAECFACIQVPGGISKCYKIDCNDLPEGKIEKNNIRTAH